jgi:putative (di)nucleoside polyphosphate hydrolase
MYRKGVSALIINENNEFLIVNLDSFGPQYFAIPGGGIEEGETLEQAVYREMQEELSIQKCDLKFLGKSENPVRVNFKTIKLSREGVEYTGSERYFFGFRFTGDMDSIQPAAGEVRSYKWVSIEHLKDHLLFDNQLEETAEKIMEIFPMLAGVTRNKN